MSKRNKSKNRKEDILYLTLIDFFLQMLFLMMIALLFYIVYYWGCVKIIGTAPDLFTEDMVLVEKKLKEDGDAALAFIEANGGQKTIEEAIKKMKKGMGLPSCAGNDAEGKPKSIATFVATATTISLTQWEPEFADLAKTLGKPPLQNNMQWSLKGFVATWNKALVVKPQCRYTVTLIERSGLVRPRDHVQSIFYAKIRR